MFSKTKQFTSLPQTNYLVLSIRPRLFKRWIAPSIGKITIQRISIRKTDCTIHWTEIYPLDNIIHLLNNSAQIKNYPLSLSIRETNCTIQGIEIYLAAMDSIIHLLNTWSLVPVVQKLDSANQLLNNWDQAPVVQKLDKY